MTNGDGKAAHTISLIGHTLRFATPILLMVIGYTYIRDQEIQRERHDRLIDKFSDAQSSLRQLDEELEEIGKELAVRGLKIENLEDETKVHYLLINEHESRIRNLELEKR